MQHHFISNMYDTFFSKERKKVLGLASIIYKKFLLMCKGISAPKIHFYKLKREGCRATMEIIPEDF